MLESTWTRASGLIDRVIGTEWPSEDVQQHARLVALVVFVMFIPGALYLVHFVQTDVLWMAMAVAGTMAVSLINLLSLRRTRNPAVAGVLGAASFFVLLGLSAFSTGGFYGPNFAWLYVIPVFAALLANMRAGAVFTGLVLLLAVGFWVAGELLGITMTNYIPEEERAIRSLFDRGGAILAIGVAIAIVASRERHESQKLSDAYQSLKLEMQQREQLHDRMIHTERLASMGKLSAAVAHEINNPMTYVIGNLQALQEQDLSGEDEQHELIRDALDGAMRVSALVKDMQVYSRTPGKLHLDVVDIAGALDTAAKMVSSKVRYAATFRQECEPGLKALASEAQLVQVIVNLLTNAIDAIDGRVEDNELSLEARTCSEGVLITVQDSGCGIPLAVQKRLFEPFYTTKDIGQGTGMGLAISRSLMEGMNGRIRFESSENDGTRFFLVLPSAEMETPGSESADTPPAVDSDLALASLTILVVDDDAAVLRSIGRMLKHHNVVTEEDAREALERCRDGSFDLILCDIMMPAMSGDLFFRALEKARPELAERVTFMTGGVLTTDTEEFLHSAERPVLAKPLDIEQIRALTSELGRSTGP